MNAKELVDTEKMPVFIALSILLAILLITLAPEDKTLGSMLKLICLHGALIVTGLFLFSTAGLIALISLFRSSSTLSFLFAFEKTAIIFWVTATIVGDIASQLVWGGILLSEPRFQVTILVSILSIGIYFISTALNNPRAISILGIGLAISVWIFMIRIGRILHPENPFRVSESPIQLFYAAITLLFIITSILVAVWMRKKTGCSLELKPE